MSGNVPASTRTLRVLTFLATQPGPVPMERIASAVGLPRSSTYHLLKAMIAEGFVVHLPEEKRYGLGVAAFEIGSAYLRHDPLERLARPLLAQLVADVGQTAHLGVLHGRELVYLLKEQPPRPVTLVTDIGVRLPATLTASGRALLAALPPAQVRALFPTPETFVRRTDQGPQTLSQLRRLLADERRQGYAVEDSHVTPGVASVASAALDHAGHPVASISVSFRSEAIPPPERALLARRVRQTADALTRRLRG
ncbi:IclR family transcriptional regulator [Kribbella sp. VKM Ac-2527]|uniref:Glycerol operon regulatory protein n=1 Tax=Kribbella caucasensis TaxID=2512215 RepID=A0A4V3CB50_9ACTN|nr:IclR family transcriptional regulator [Kribbella sp. VKM Ac-2527]TDO54540.1 IclR family transcriptional regulator [Kribbella sp. VKM Ac-2527]